MTGKFAILVGNGFTIDFLSHNKSSYNSSLPLRNFGSPSISYDSFINQMPSIKEKLVKTNGDDFELINNFSKQYSLSSKEFGHLRQFLALSYSHLHTKVINYNYVNWKWYEWFRKNRHNLFCSISLNYDLILESTLNKLNIAHYRVGTDEPVFGSMVLKPHGSIDFDMPSFAFSIPKKLRLQGTTSLNDAQFVQVIKSSEFLDPRIEADIIPPTMHNFQKELSWVNRQSQFYLSISQELQSFIIVGSSYWDVDRPEIDFYLENLPKNATVYIGTKEPHPDLIRKLFFLRLKHRTFDFDELPW